MSEAVRNAPQNWPKLALAPHPLAPTFANEKNPDLFIKHLISEVTSTNMSASENVLKLLREAGFVSLWFYLKYIAGFDGPYNLLNSDLHVDMCNFRQRVATESGIKAALIVPRACYKSTIASHGANGWELLRDPNLRIGCTSQLYDRALGFVQSTVSTFTTNEFHKALYPEYAKENRSNTEMILTNRTRRFPEPNLMAITAGGSTQGIHVDLFDCDDIVGEDMLNGDHVSGAEMLRMRNWLFSNLKNLVVSWKKSRIMVVGTRYSIDDPYERPMKESREHLGYWRPIESDYEIDLKGEWITYYRPAKQETAEGVEYSINPDSFTVEALDKLLETDPWVYQSQYANNPVAAGASDFSGYEVGEINVEWNDVQETYEIVRDRGLEAELRIDLRNCDLVIVGDPSGGSTKATMSASRAAMVVLATDSKGNRYLIDAEVAFVEPTKFFDWLFLYKRKYGLKVRGTFVETQGGFKAFVSILRKEQMLRKEFLNFVGVPALGDKETTIRNIIQPLLFKGKLFVRKELRGKLMEELRVFPSRRMDLLDALKIAIFKSIVPKVAEDEDDDFEDDHRVRRKTRDVSAVTGY